MNIKSSSSSRTEIRRFLFSDIPEESQVVYKKIVEALGGIVESTTKNFFTSSCTHVIAKAFTNTEKVLCALAGGKWVLCTDYLSDSSKVGHWIDERRYELPDHVEVARYCRLYWAKFKKGFFSGKTIYIKLSNQGITKSFRKIVQEGGAQTVSSSHSKNANLAITDQELLPFVRALVCPEIPIVTITYLKETLLMKADPSNFSPYLLDDSRNVDINGTPAKCVSDRVKENGWTRSPEKRSCSEACHNNNNSTGLKNNEKFQSSKKADLSHFHTDVNGTPTQSDSDRAEENDWASCPEKWRLCESFHSNSNRNTSWNNNKKYPSPRECKRSYIQKRDCIQSTPPDNVVSSTVQANRAINSSNKRKYQRIPFSPAKYHSIKNFFTPSSRSEAQGARKSLGQSLHCSQSEQTIAKNSCSPGNSEHQQLPEVQERRTENSSQRHSTSNKSHKKPYKRTEASSPRPSQPCINGSRRDTYRIGRSSPRPSKPTANGSPKRAYERRTESISPRPRMQSINGSPRNACECTVESSYPRPPKPSINENPWKPHHKINNGINVRSGVSDECKVARKLGEENQGYINDSTAQKKVTTISRLYNLEDCTSHLLSRNSPKTFTRKSNCLNKEVTVELLRLEEQYRLSKKCMNSLRRGETVKLKNSSTTQQPSSSIPLRVVVSHEDMTRGIMKFIRRSKVQDNIYCGNIQCLHMECSPGNCAKIGEVSIDSSHQHPKMRQLSLKETSYYESCLDHETNMEGLIANGLDSLWLCVTPTTYPSAQLLGDLLRKLVLETKLSLIHHQGLSLAHQILLLHPPATPPMKTYYLRVIEAATQDVHGSHRAWGFMHHLIELLQYSCDMESEIDSLTGSMDTTPPIVINHALHLLQFLVMLLREDLKYHVTGDSVRQLLIWKVFLGHAYHLSNATPPIKQLLQRWVYMQSVHPAVRQCLVQLVSLLIEMAWRFSTTPLYPASPIPQSLSAIGTELHICLKDSGPSTVVRLMRELPSPWIKAVVGAVIFQEVTQSPNIALILSNLMDYFYAVNVQQEHIHSKDSQRMSAEDGKSFMQKKIRVRPHNINKQNFKGETFLMRACIREDAERVQVLLKVPGVDLNMSDHCGWTPLHEAAIRGNETIIQLLLSFNCYDALGTYSFLKRDHCSKIVNARACGGEDNRTPLHDAVENDHQGAVKLLLDYGGIELLEDRDREGRSAVDLAQNMEMLNILNSYKSKGYKGDSLTKFSKPSVITSGLGLPTGLLPSREDRLAFIISLANSYLEVSGCRCVVYSLKRKIEVKNSTSSQRDSKECDTVRESGSENCRERNENSESASRKRKLSTEEQLTPESSLCKSDAVLRDRIYEYMKLDLITYKELLEAEEVNQSCDRVLEQLKHLKYLLL